MARTQSRELSAGQIVPNFTLPSIAGGKVSVRDFRQRRNLVIIHMDVSRCDECISVLREFGDDYQTYRDLETEILVVLPHSLAEIGSRLGGMDLPFPVLSDEGGRVTELYLGHPPGRGPVATVFLTDRYGDLRVEMRAEEAGEMPNRQAIVDWLSLLETECPECGTAEGSWTG
jgi:thioredoxin-dependent peroxiredoxin